VRVEHQPADLPGALQPLVNQTVLFDQLVAGRADVFPEAQEGPDDAVLVSFFSRVAKLPSERAAAGRRISSRRCRTRAISWPRSWRNVISCGWTSVEAGGGGASSSGIMPTGMAGINANDCSCGEKSLMFLLSLIRRGPDFELCCGQLCVTNRRAGQ
jgi:hypothetical protein